MTKCSDGVSAIQEVIEPVCDTSGCRAINVKPRSDANNKWIGNTLKAVITSLKYLTGK